MWYRYDEDDHVELTCNDVRPRARTNIKFADVNIGHTVMANYNMEEPDERGFWYDCVITDKLDTRTQKKLTATVYFGLVYFICHVCNGYTYTLKICVVCMLKICTFIYENFAYLKDTFP